MNRPYLQIETAAGRQQLVLGNEPLSIGRHKDNRLVLDDKMASRFHCIIEKVPDGYLLRDLGASNGTRVNGRVVKSALLAPGDVVAVGNTELVLVLPGMELDPVKLDHLEALATQAASAKQDEQYEPLTEDDLVDGDAEGNPEAPDEPIPIEAVEVAPARAYQPPPSSAQVGDFEPEMRRLAEGAAEKPFGEYDITLMSPRGTVAYAPGPPKGGRQVIDLVRLMLLVSFRGRGSDIHVEQKGETAQIRVRINGVMIDVARLPADVGNRLIAAVKVLSDIDPSQRNIIQEGHFSVRVPDHRLQHPSRQRHAALAPPSDGLRRIDCRVSLAPAVFGQKLVIRVLDPVGAPAMIGDMGLPPDLAKELNWAMEQDAGMVLVCGPTGSGKTSSLYALLRSIDVRERNVITIEDPVEIQLDGATQIPVDESQGNTFPALLRSVLRQDPDVILVGEIRDPETARIAMQSSITGHLVLSTAHTRDTVGTIFRLLDLGVEAYMLSQGLHVVLAQRLVRQLCPICKTPRPLTAEQSSRMGPVAEGVVRTFAPVGCHRCLGTGYSGRRAFYELLIVNQALRDVISRSPTAVDVQNALTGTPFERLSTAGYRLVAEGAVAFDEIDRAVGR